MPSQIANEEGVTGRSRGIHRLASSPRPLETPFAPTPPGNVPRRADQLPDGPSITKGASYVTRRMTAMTAGPTQRRVSKTIRSREPVAEGEARCPSPPKRLTFVLIGACIPRPPGRRERDGPSVAETAPYSTDPLGGLASAPHVLEVLVQSFSAVYSFGSRTAKRVPSPFSVATSIEPLSASTRRSVIERPNPVPSYSRSIPSDS